MTRVPPPCQDVLGTVTDLLIVEVNSERLRGVNEAEGNADGV